MKLISIQEIRKFLKESENPLFIFDNDGDGLCSYALLYNYIGRGKPFITTGGNLDDRNIINKVNDYSPDAIFILDVPVISQKFIDSLKCRRIVWVDHHPVIDLKGVYYYNPLVKKQSNYKPTSEICYGISRGKKWIGGLGIIHDYKIPKFIGDLKKDYKDLFGDAKTIEDILFNSKFGELVSIVGYNLKGKWSEVKRFIETFPRIESPYEIFKGTTARGKFIFNKYKIFKKKYDALFDDAMKNGKIKGKLFVFTYPGYKDSFTGELAAHLKYKLRDKIILVGRDKGDEVRFSIRGNTPIRDMAKKALENVNGRGGGHPMAVGGSVKKYDFYKFVDLFLREIMKKQP